MAAEPPIVEFPDDVLTSVKQAISEAISRIRSADASQRWAVLSAQGEGARADSYRIREVRFRADVLDFGEAVPELLDLARDAGVDPSAIEPRPDGTTARVARASAPAVADLLDAVFRRHFEIRPFDGEPDYAFGAEWIPDEAVDNKGRG
jgi:hypothetical protein